jgi:hypothetical protein
MNVSDDPRWRELQDRPWVCHGCGGTHVGLFDLVIAHPAAWPAQEPPLAEGAVPEREHFLTEDLCVVDGEHRFIRCTLPLRIAGTDRVFSFGIWSSLSKPNFLTYARTFGDARGGSEGPWFGWFSNRLPFYPDTLNLKCRVHPQDGGQRPRIELEPTDHPLSVDQRRGITLDRLLDLYAAAGHEPAGLTG